MRPTYQCVSDVLILFFSKQNSGTERPCQLISKINEMANGSFLNVPDKGAEYKILFKLSLRSLVQIP